MNTLFKKLKKWKNISEGQLKVEWKIYLFGFVVFSIFFGLAFLVLSKLIQTTQISDVFSANYDTLKGKDKIPVSTITTTLFTTLMTVLLGLISLAITVYVFLSDNLGNRQPYEIDTVKELKNSSVRKLFRSAIATGFCIIGCLFLDNANLKQNIYLTVLRYLILFMSFGTIWFLLCYVEGIIHYERKIVNLAKGYIEHYTDKHKNIRVENDENVTESIKKISDLEMLVRRVIDNHEDEFHGYPSIMESNILKLILKRKGEKLDTPQINKHCDLLVELIKLRNNIRIVMEGDPDYKVNIDLTETTQQLINDLACYAFENELLKNLNFVHFEMKKANLKHTSFQNAAFLNTKLKEAELSYSDFTNALLQNVNLENADCENAVFVGTRFVNIDFASVKSFSGAVFANADFTGCEIIKGSDKRKLDFSATGCEKANFAGVQLEYIDFSSSVLRGALLSGIELINCDLSYSDCMNLNIVKTVIEGTNFKYANLEGTLAANSKWKGVCKQYIDLNHVRMARANFLKADMSFCDFSGAYINDASLMETTLKNCRFLNAWITNADFTGANIEECEFNHACFIGALFIGNSDKEKSKMQNVEFEGAIFNNSLIRDYIFENCKFNQASFDGAMILDSQFVNCEFENIHHDLELIQLRNDFYDCENPFIELVHESSSIQEDIMSVEVAIQKRCSTRAFAADYLLSKRKLSKILEAGLYAPSPKDRQPWSYCVIEKKVDLKNIGNILKVKLDKLIELRKEQGDLEISDLCMARNTAAIIKKVSALVLVGYHRSSSLVDKEQMDWELKIEGCTVVDIQSIGASVENMLLCATEMEIDSLWMGDILFAEEEIRRSFQIADPIIAAIGFGKEKHKVGNLGINDKIKHKVRFYNEGK